MALFRLGQEGGTIAVFPDQDDRFNMREFAAPLHASVDKIQISGLIVQCQGDGKSIRTFEELRRSAQLVGCLEDGTQANPFILTVSGVKPQKFEATDAITSASIAAEYCAATFAKQQFYDFRPNKTLPLGIYVKAFGLVRDALAMDPRNISSRTWTFVQELREEMAAPFPGEGGLPDEDRRQQSFTNRLRSYLADTLSPDFIVVSNKEPSPYHTLPLGKGPDIKIFVRVGRTEVLLIASIGVKAEMGFDGEPSVENLIYYSHQVSNTCHKDIYFTGYPMLLMELVGPNLRLAAAYFMDKAVLEPMTPYVSLLQLHDPAHLRQLGCMATAMQVALTALRDVYRNAPSRPMLLRCEGALHWPYRLQELYPAANVERLYAGKAVFRVIDGGSTSKSKNKLVKFVQERYGEEAHKQWAKCGHAPEFELEELAGSWKMITMPWLGMEEGWFNLDELKIARPSEWRGFKDAVGSALHRLQSQTQMVHGDIRAANVMCNVGSEEVMFIDFEWAGPCGSVLYPPLLNQHLAWPHGVKGNVPILAQHDREAVEIIFR